jgi:hypothetical protein
VACPQRHQPGHIEGKHHSTGDARHGAKRQLFQTIGSFPNGILGIRQALGVYARDDPMRFRRHRRESAAGPQLLADMVNQVKKYANARYANLGGDNGLLRPL